MFFLLNKCFPLRKTSNYIHKYSQIAFASDRVANAKKGARTSLFPRSPHLFSSSYSLLLSSASTDADARNGRRGCSYRPTRMLVSVGADARIDRRRWLLLMFHSAKPLLSCCQIVAFAVPNRYFCAAKPLLLRFKTSLFTFYTLFFLQYLPLFSSISSAFLLCASSGCSP